jgi:hypothetical protein
MVLLLKSGPQPTDRDDGANRHGNRLSYYQRDMHMYVDKISHKFKLSLNPAIG